TGRADKTNIVNDNGVIVNSAGARINILRMSLKAFKEKPFLGSGPDTLMERLQTDFKADIEMHNKIYNEWPDKAHNEYLEYAVSCGIFSLLAYLLLIGSIVIGLLKNIKEDIAKVMLLCLIGYLIQAFFNISVIRVAPLYWIMLGVFVKYINTKSESKSMIS
ncbi:MAG: O-antigen ligase family protein, partial [Clostridium sp.]